MGRILEVLRDEVAHAGLLWLRIREREIQNDSQFLTWTVQSMVMSSSDLEPVGGEGR